MAAFIDKYFTAYAAHILKKSEANCHEATPYIVEPIYS